MKNAWEIRNVKYEDIHNVDAGSFGVLVAALNIQNNDIIADLMSGYGAVTREILKYCAAANKKIQPPILLDLYPCQLTRSKKELDGKDIKTILADVRECPFESYSLDKVVIKMGIHELPKNDQQLVFKQIHRVLKSKGIFLVWDVMPETEKEQILFQDIIRKKDQLARFDSFVCDRYFFRKAEATKYFQDAGFQNIKYIHKILYRLSTIKRLDTEFGGDQKKLDMWNEYIRYRIPEDLKRPLHYTDNGKTIEMTFEKGIIVGEK